LAALSIQYIISMPLGLLGPWGIILLQYRGFMAVSAQILNIQ
jgi:hypothetical protein